MAVRPNLRPSTSFQFISQTASASVVLIGLLLVIGWIFDITTFKGVLPGLVTMKVNTAVGFILAGVALLTIDQASPSTRRIGRVSARGESYSCAHIHHSGELGGIFSHERKK